MSLPVIQAPIGSASTPALAAAVSGAGGLGVLGLSWATVEDAVRQVRETKRLTPRPFGVNVAMEWPQHKRLAACLAEGVRVVSTFWGDPSPYIDMIREAGAVHLHTVGSAQEARRVADLGVDAVVAQGWEAGGHVWGTVSTMVLVPSVVDAVKPCLEFPFGMRTRERGAQPSGLGVHPGDDPVPPVHTSRAHPAAFELQR